jgi:hypothetical protein
MQHLSGAPNLEPLPAAEQKVLLKALAKQRKRFAAAPEPEN